MRAMHGTRGRGPPLRRFARMAALAVVLGALVITGLLLGGFAGAVIVPAATCLFLVSNADLPALTEGGFAMGRLWRPRVLAGLLIAASICGAAGAHASQAGSTGLAVTALLNGVPQLICLVIVGRLAAAIILSLPGPPYRGGGDTEVMLNASPRLRRAGLVAVLLAAAALGALASLLFGGQPPPTAAWTSWLNGGLEDYAATAGQWNSGDNAVQVALPGDRALWLFNDSYDGPVGDDGTVRPGTPLVRNLLLLTSGSGDSFQVIQTITGRPVNGVPTAAVPPVAGSPAGSWAWPAGGIVTGNSVQAIYTVFAPQGPDPFNYVPVANEVVTMPLASLTQPSRYVIKPAGFGQASRDGRLRHRRHRGAGGAGCVQWGVGLLNATSCPRGLAACTYIYGEMWPSPGDSSRTLVVAVAPRGGLADPGTWWYDTAAGWSRSPSGLAAPLGRGSSFGVGSVYRLPGGNYVVLGSSPADGIVAWYAPNPRLSGARFARLFSAPGARGIPGFLAYQAHIVPAYSRGTGVVIGFSVNSFAHDRDCVNYAPYYDVSAYQPEFYSVTLPPRAGIGGGPRPLPPPRLRPFRPWDRPTPPARSWSSGSCP